MATTVFVVPKSMPIDVRLRISDLATVVVPSGDIYGLTLNTASLRSCGTAESGGLRAVRQRPLSAPCIDCRRDYG